MISEERLRQAAHEAGRALGDSLPDPEACQHTFSPAFEKRMDTLRRKSRYMGLNQGLRRVACFFLALLVCGGTWLSVDAEARGAVFGWVSETLGGERHYFFQGVYTADDAVQYTLPLLPDGYQPLDFYENEGYVSNAYVGPDGEKLLWFEYVVGDDWEMWLTLDDIGAMIPVLVKEEPAEFYPAESEDVSSTLVWRDRETGVILYLSGFFDQETLIQLAESVQREK